MFTNHGIPFQLHTKVGRKCDNFFHPQVGKPLGTSPANLRMKEKIVQKSLLEKD